MPTHSAFQQFQRKAAQKPARVVVISPAEFSDQADKRPETDIAVGLRRLSETSEQGAMVEAAKRARELWPEGSANEDLIAAANEALLCIVVARSLCDPNDVSRGHSAFPAAEDTLPKMLTSRAIRRLWDEIELMAIETSPLQPEATDEQLEALAVDLLTKPQELRLLGPAREKRVRRLLAFVADETALLFSDQAEAS